jgi:ribose 5-phosphate isomerase B
VRIVFGTDEETPVTRAILEHVSELGHAVTVTAAGEEWPEVGRAVGEAVASGRAERGVVCCWTGTGVSIAANKVNGVRAALCTDAETASGARRWNDANVVAIGLRLTSEAVARELVSAFHSTEPDTGSAVAVARVEPAAAVGRVEPAAAGAGD